MSSDASLAAAVQAAASGDRSAAVNHYVQAGQAMSDTDPGGATYAFLLASQHADDDEMKDRLAEQAQQFSLAAGNYDKASEIALARASSAESADDRLTAVRLYLACTVYAATYLAEAAKSSLAANSIAAGIEAMDSTLERINYCRGRLRDLTKA
ncbi:hypothetical protein [Actinoplanes friuliensis]|uniref:hypothetical protein n=1 Tax=Actinoplanes friuliensis TaxID=196914 RepID=UPI0011DD905E|nr:hypothetical protein [Actinoplanes friuliensis]